jgi:hypothetical protein
LRESDFLPPRDAHRVQGLHTNLAARANFQIVSNTYDGVCKVCTCTLVLWPFDRRIGLRHNVDQDGLNMRDRVLRIESKAALQLLNDGVG